MNSFCFIVVKNNYGYVAVDPGGYFQPGFGIKQVDYYRKIEIIAPKFESKAERILSQFEAETFHGNNSWNRVRQLISDLRAVIS